MTVAVAVRDVIVPVVAGQPGPVLRELAAVPIHDGLPDPPAACVFSISKPLVAALAQVSSVAPLAEPY